MGKPRVKPPKKDRDYEWLWRIVDAAVMDAITTHPEYVKADLIPYARLSINKRVVGRVIGELRRDAKSEEPSQLTKSLGLATTGPVPPD